MRAAGQACSSATENSRGASKLNQRKVVLLSLIAPHKALKAFSPKLDDSKSKRVSVVFMRNAFANAAPPAHVNGLRDTSKFCKLVC